MQSGEYILNRMLPGAVAAACQRQGVDYEAFSDEWILRLRKGPVTHWVFGYKLDINNAASSHLAQDKVGTYAILEDEGLPVVRHQLVRAVASQPINAAELQNSFPEGDVVIKPLSGTGGRGVERYRSVDEAITFIQSSPEPSWAISPYLDIVSETRLIVLDGKVLVGYEKQNPTIVNGLKFYNLSHGARASTFESIPINFERIAVKTCSALGLRLAAVDIVETTEGKQRVLEVNDGFFMEYYAQQSAENMQRALSLYDSIIKRMFQ